MAWSKKIPGLSGTGYLFKPDMAKLISLMPKISIGGGGGGELDPHKLVTKDMISQIKDINPFEKIRLIRKLKE